MLVPLIHMFVEDAVVKRFFQKRAKARKICILVEKWDKGLCLLYKFNPWQLDITVQHKI